MTAWTRVFAQPWALWLLVALPAVTVLWTWSRWRRRQALAGLGTLFLVERLVRLRPRMRHWQSLLVLLGVTALIAGIAGPRWGVAQQPELLSGKDIVVVLDLSKSMAAEQPSRFERARRALRDLAGALEARGGHRVALVIFAALAKLQFPLTSDYDHFRFALEELDPENVPPALRPQAAAKAGSGTRIGEALRLAVAVHAADRAGLQDIILLSDGDDPAADDEWLQGAQAARERGMPVHVVAIGDPREPHPIRLGGAVVRHDGTIVKSKLNEPLLQEIARRTGGIYFPAHQTSLPLGRLLRGHLESGATATTAQSPLIQTETHYALFLAIALALLGMSMLVSEGPRFVAPADSKALVKSSRPPSPSVLSWSLVVLLPCLISADRHAPADDLVRQGNAAFKRQEFELALHLYAQAAPGSADPGLISMNQGAALYRMGRFDEAAAAYERCLEDGAIPIARRARAGYDLGTAILQTGHQDRGRLERAIAAFRLCLDSKPDPDLQRDARHNLELAKWLWIQAKPPATAEPPNAVDQNPSAVTPPDRKDNGATQSKNKPLGGAIEEGTGEKGGVAEGGADADRKKKLAHGALQVLPDADQLQPLSPEAAAAHLDRLASRILRERRQYWQQVGPPATGVKDW